MLTHGNLNRHQIVPHVPAKTSLLHRKHCFGVSSELLLHVLHEMQWVQSLSPFYWYLIFEVELNTAFEVSLSQTKECSLGTAIKCCCFASDNIIGFCLFNSFKKMERENLTFIFGSLINNLKTQQISSTLKTLLIKWVRGDKKVLHS